MPDALLGRRALIRGAGGLVLATAAVSSTLAPATAAGIDTKAALTLALDRYAATRTGTFGLMLLDNRNSSFYSWRPRSLQSLSTIKVLILVALLRRAQERSQGLTTSQKALASRMIRYSDNSATDTLLRQVGVSTCQRVADQLGMRDTVVRGGSSGWWGYSTVSNRDLVTLMTHLVRGTYLSPGRLAYVRDLMARVTPSQTWGVGDPLPSTVHVEQKNGWGPMSTGYRLNSFGYVSGSGRNYQMSLLSTSPRGFSYGKATLNQMSRMVYDALDKPLT